MAGPIKMYQDWTQVKEIKKDLLAFLNRTPAGAGVSVEGGLTNPLMARALIEILKENPNSIEMMDNGASITLMRKISMTQSMSRDSYSDLRAKHQIMSADTVKEFGLSGTSQLPVRKFRDGVPDDINDGGPQTLDTKLILP